MEPTSPDGSTQVMVFGKGKKAQLDGEIVEWTIDHVHNQQAFALLNNQVTLTNFDFQQTVKLSLEGDKKINALKLSEGLVCVAGEDKIVRLYDPKDGKIVKRLIGRLNI